MNFLSSLGKGGDSKQSGEEKPSGTDLFSNAKVVAEAAQAQFGNEPEKYDKAKAAGAGADLLEAASDYGKLDGTKGVGKYVDQAEGYLRQYDSTSQTTPAAAAAEKAEPEDFSSKPSEGGEETGGYVKKAEELYDEPTEGGHVKKAEEFVSQPAEGGAGDYVKKAEDFSSKRYDEGSEGDYVKKAEDFSSKPYDEGNEGDYVNKAEDFSSKPYDEGSKGDYVNKAEGKPYEEGRSEASGAGDYIKEAPSQGSFESGGAGDYIKKAGDFLSKPSDGGEKADSEGGYGGFRKAAGGFMNN